MCILLQQYDVMCIHECVYRNITCVSVKYAVIYTICYIY